MNSHMSADSPRVSVILPVYNGARYLRETLSSVLGQSMADLEVVAVDDGSTDESGAILEGIDDPRLIVTHQENRGISATRNAAIRAARAPFVAFIDQDDLWAGEKLEKQLAAFGDDPEVGLVHCQAGRIDEHSKKLSGGPVVAASWLAGDVRRMMLVGNAVPGTAAVVVRREVFDEVGYFDEELNGADDWDMWSRIAARYRFAYLPEALAFTRLHPANTSTDVERMRADSLRVMEKLYADPEMVRGIGPRELEKLRRKGRARLHAYCATWLIRTGRTRAASADLWRAFRQHPLKPRHSVLLFFSLLGWVPGFVKRRLI